MRIILFIFVVRWTAAVVYTPWNTWSSGFSTDLCYRNGGEIRTRTCKLGMPVLKVVLLKYTKATQNNKKIFF